jgi:hypothetical protein
MRIHSRKIWWTLATILILSALTVSLVAQQISSLTIAGQPGSAKVVQVDGRNYVEVEGLARLTNSSISFNSNQIVLTLPGSTPDASVSAPPPAGFSKDFVTAGIEAMAQIREWHAALKNAIERGYPLADSWLAPYRNQAQQAVRLTSLAASTSSDKNAFPFLTNEFNNMQKLTAKYLQMATSMTYFSTDSLDNDPLDQKIRTCARSMASMATANQFVDDGSCQ